MNKKMMKEIMILVTLSLLALIMPFFVFMLPPLLMLSLWITGILGLLVMKHRNPKTWDSKRYQRRIFTLIIILLMTAGITVSLFPQESSIPVIELILGGSS